VVIKRLIKRVVVTGVAADPGLAVAAAFKRHGWLVVGVDSQFRPGHVNQFYVVSHGTHPGFLDELLLVVRRERSTLVVPTRSADILPLAVRQQELHRLGAALYVPLAHTAEDLVDPVLWSRHLRRAGLVAAPEDTAQPSHDHRVFEANLLRDSQAPHDVLNCTLFELVCDPSSPEPRLRAERRKDEPAIEEAARRVAAALEVRGPLTVRFSVRGDDDPVVVGLWPIPCVHGPLLDGMFDAIRSLWERDQPG
jgi:hypothetical protein